MRGIEGGESVGMEVGLKLVFDKESNVEDVIGKISGAFGENDGLQSISEIACKESKIDYLAQLARRAHNAELDLWKYRAVAATLNDAKRLLRELKEELDQINFDFSVWDG